MAEPREIIRTLEQELEATQQRCALIERAIAGMREVFRIPDDVDDDVAETVPARKRRGRRPTPTGRPVRNKSTAADDDGRTAAIVETLDANDGSMKPGELAGALRISLLVLRRWIKPLLKSKAIIATGRTAGRRFSLPGRVPKEAL